MDKKNKLKLGQTKQYFNRASKGKAKKITSVQSFHQMSSLYAFETDCEKVKLEYTTDRKE